MKNVKFIYNPDSGENAITEHLDEITAMHQQAGFSLCLHRLDFSTPASEIMGDLNDTFDHLLISGGDGTVNYVINMMQECGVNLPVGIIPSGTANDFAGALKIPKDIIEACRRSIYGTPRAIDLGKVNDKFFVNILSCGLFTDVSQRTTTLMKNTFGKVAYYVEGLGELPRFRNMQLRIESDSGSYEGTSLIFFVFNGRTAGNFPIAHSSELDDGLLDVLIVKGDNPILALQTVLKYLQGILRKRYPKNVIHMQCHRLDVFSERNEPTDIDGQPGPDFPLHVTCRAGVLKVLL